MLENYLKAGVTLTTKTTTRIINHVTNNKYLKEPLITYKENNEITPNIYNDNPEQKETLEKIIKLCPQITKLLEQETMIQKGDYKLIL